MPTLNLDRRVGSGELEKYFHKYGITPKVTTLEFGDFSWLGEGWDKDSNEPATVSVVVERKKINDLADSMTSKRLAGYQLRGMDEHYDFGYLIVEGLWRPGDSGELETYQGVGWRQHGLMWAAVDGYIDSLGLRGGMIVVRTASPTETVAAVVNRYKRWQTPWLEHRSHDTIYAPTSEGLGEFGGLVKRKITVCENMAYQIPGIGEKARYVAEHFKFSAADMCRSGVDKWTGLEWKDKKGNVKKVSRAAAQKIEAVLRNSNGAGLGVKKVDLEEDN